MRHIDHSDVHATLREMWETRPGRRSDDRMVAGVAAAIARRYDIDPVLVRIGFVVAAFSGIGAALYIAGWIALPVESSEPGEQRPSQPRRALIVTGLVIAVLATFGWFGGGGPGPEPILIGLVALGLLYLLHRSRSERPVGTAYQHAPVAAPDAPTTQTGPSLLKETPLGEPAVTPPSWDPLGAAPFAWDLPEPSPAPDPQPARRRPPVTPVTLGIALLAAGITSTVLLLAGAFTPANVPVLLGVLLAVVGLGLVVGSFVRAGRGLIPIALLLAALTWGALAVPATTWRGGQFGDMRVAPASVGQIQPRYEHGVGDVRIDLSDVDFSAPAGTAAMPVRSEIRMGAGDLTVIVPPDTDLTVEGVLGAGELIVGDRREDGMDLQVRSTDLGSDGVAAGRPLVLDVDLGVGKLEVSRG